MRTRITVGAVVLAAALAVTIAVLWRPGTGTPAAQREPIATTTITRETLTDVVTVNGKLAYGPPTGAESRLPGTITALAPIGSTVQRGQTVFRVDDTPVVLMYGDVPAYRELNAGKAAVPGPPATPAVTPSQGRDVRQFEQNLKALGYNGFSADDTFTVQTAAAVRHWQHDLGVPETGVVDLGRVFYAHGPIRVDAQLLHPGQTAAGPVLTYTGTTRLVTAEVPAREEALAKAGTNVTVALPGGAEIGGVVQSVRTPADQGGQEPIVEAVVAFDAADAQEGPVRVRLVAARRDDVLAVPVGALLALAEGGYGLEIVDGTTSRVVAVRTGLFAGGKVEVNGPISEGQTVGMAQ
ncbi:peptidoglycan-binding protein [Hamadaea tsunoensis]|uniref:peptidoglycan-binding protein n=1 Tax=Hamadaea tsunoensis TaxID=53368 RepID=UPI000411502C|nr:peptidoglycan-binding protein [Hamadaea tsunoensis]